jgi:pimeloyl-ACP methyl ester carboxylesterase
MKLRQPVSNAIVVLLAVSALASYAQIGTSTATAGNTVRTDHFVPVVSSVPAMTGYVSQLYVRERSATVSPAGNLEGKVVLFVHGAGTPAEVAFDVPYAGFSWMSYLAERGFDTFAMDMTGYGRSTRPLLMNDRCNLSEEQQLQEFSSACPPSYPFAATTMASDWDDIDAVVNYLRELRGVDKVHLVGWSQGGPRAAGYAALHPEKVANVVLLAPAYNRQGAATAEEAGIPGVAITKQSRVDFIANWDRQVGCDKQYEPAVADVIWQDMLESDPVGATWGTGVRRAPRTPTFGWTQAEVAATQIPILMVAGTHDGQVNPERVREFYADLGASNKVYIEMHCASHNAMWEKDAEQLFDASWQWLNSGTYAGQSNGTFDIE